jgi:hypothetical protein
VSFYDCRPEDTYPGREKIFKFTVKERCNLQVALFIQGSRNLDIFLFKYYCGGIFTDCVGSDFSFGGDMGYIDGTMKNCTSGDNSFAPVGTINST